VKLRHLPEYHIAISALSDLNKSETSLVHSQAKTFGEEFARFAKRQRDDLSEALTGINAAGPQQVKRNQGTLGALQNLPRYLESLLHQETARSKLREQCSDAQALAEKSSAAADKAEAAHARIKDSGKIPDIAKAEGAAVAARKKSDNDRTSADTLQHKLEETEGPYRHKFVESLVVPLSAAFDTRYKAAERALSLAADFEAAADKIHDIEDPEIAKYQEVLQKLEAEVVE
jgi:hypothetical protein